jgi:hypothetical protein
MVWVQSFGVSVSFLLLGVIALLWIMRLARWLVLGGRDVEDWAQAHSLVLTAQNRPMICYYLRTATLLRVAGVVAGAVLPTFVVMALDGRRHGLAPFTGVAGAYVGFLVGALYAELALSRPTGRRRAASLAPRTIGDYLPGHHLWGQRLLALAVAAAGAVALGLDTGSPVWVDGRGASGRDAVTVAVLAVAVAVAVEALERWVVRRPQPLSRPDLVAADDAIRSQSVHTLCGSGLALLVLLGSAQAAVLGQREIGELRRPAFAAAAGGLLASYVICVWFGNRRWRVRRPVAAIG